MSTVQNMNVLTAVNALQATPSTFALATTVLFANALVTSPVSVLTDNAPSVMIQDTSLATALSLRTPARGLSLMREICYGTRSWPYLFHCTFTTFNYRFSFHVYRPYYLFC